VEKKNNVLIVMNVILMLLVIGLGVYLVVDKNNDKKPSQDLQGNVQQPSGSQGTDKEKDKLTDSFEITVNGKKHQVDVKYKAKANYDENLSATYVATVYYDGKKLIEYSDWLDKQILTEKEAEKYTLDDFENKIQPSDFKLIRGNNNQEYIGIYDNFPSEIGPERILHILDDKGKEIFKLTDDTHTSIENHYYDDYKLTKIESNYILFFAFREKDQIKGQPIGKNVVVEYKLTLGDTLKFEKINTYKDCSIVGGGGYLNDVVPSGY